MPVHLRGHHFLCMLTYKGLGYSAEFTINMSARIDHIKNGAAVALVKGPDDICAGMSQACRNANGHDCGMQDILEMDRVAQLAVEAVLKRPLKDAATISNTELGLLRNAFQSGALRKACSGCSWFEVCNHIAATDFAGTRLLAAQT
jgi:uncharacterized protein